ncbi:MAG: glycerate kinase [Erysipelotrichaceae bacterium]
MNILICPDSFKGSLTAIEVANIIKEGLSSINSNNDYKILPLSDGGEGLVDIFIANCQGKPISTYVFGPNLFPVYATFCITENNIAVIEMASANGLSLASNPKDIMNASSYGTGELIRYALLYDVDEIIIGIGGSATNDGGVGLARALGMKFYAHDNELDFGCHLIGNINRIDNSEVNSQIYDTKITVLCDVNNPLCGKNGASYVYGPQKGASKEQVEFLDKSLAHLAHITSEYYVEYSNYPGAGAAGGLGFALKTYFYAQIKSGIHTVLELLDFEKQVQWADIIITGEGKIDRQSANGKVVMGVCEIAKKYQKPVIAMVGCIDGNIDQLYQLGLTYVQPCVKKVSSIEDAMKNAHDNLYNAAISVMPIIDKLVNKTKK